MANGRSQPRRRGRLGIGVDALGGTVIDPTENVVALVKANKERNDDLRRLIDKSVHSEIKHLRAEVKLRAKHQMQMAKAESGRLDSIRMIDAQAVQVAAAQAQTAIQTLATTASTSAETIRNALNTAAATAATQLQGLLSRVDERIRVLEQTSYTGAGKGEGFSASWAILVGAAGLALAVYLALRPMVQPIVQMMPPNTVTVPK